MDKLTPEKAIKVVTSRYKEAPKKETIAYGAIVLVGIIVAAKVTKSFNAGPATFFIFFLMVEAIGIIGKIYYNMLAYKNYDKTLDDREGVNISKEGELARNKMISLDSSEELLAFNKAQPKDILNLKDIIIGIKSGWLMMKKKERNWNILIVGIPGSGKTVCLNFPIIMQACLHKYSVVVTDPKMETYNLTAALARAYGLETKLLIFDPDFVRYSDSCNIMGFLRDAVNDPNKDPIGACKEFTKALIDNTEGKAHESKVDYWEKQDTNLILAIVETLAYSKRYKCTLEQVYNLLLKPQAEFEAEMNMEIMSIQDHPAKRPWNTYIGTDASKVRPQIYSSVGDRFGFLDSPTVRKILSTDDVDLTNPGKKPCIYYIGASFSNHTLDVVMALVFTMMFQQLSSYAKSREDETLPVRVKMLMDEFKNIGKIPDMPGKLSTVRSQGIDIIMILQGIDQLKQMYPNEEHESILNPCEMQILLSTNDLGTAEHFSKMSGVMTQVVESERYSQNIENIFGIHPEKQVTSQLVQSEVLTVGDVLTMGCDKVEREMLIKPAGHNAIKMETYYYQKHPLFQLMHKVNFQKHHPLWWGEIDEDDALRYRLDPSEITKKDEWPEIVPLTEEEVSSYDAEEYMKNWARWCEENSHDERFKICIRASEIKKMIRSGEHMSDWATYDSGL